MKKMMTEEAASSPAWDTLETFARTQVQGFVQQILEEEVEDLLGRWLALKQPDREQMGRSARACFLQCFNSRRTAEDLVAIVAEAAGD